MTTTWKNKMIEQGFNYADSTIKEMSDFFETRVKNLGAQGRKENLQQLPRNPRTRKQPRSANEQTSTPVS